MPLAVAIVAAAILREPFTDAKKLGFVLILLGVFGIAWGTGAAVDSRQSSGHAFFLGSAVAWACYTVAMRRARLDGLHAAGVAAVGALVLYMPGYLLVAGTSLAEAPWEDVALQAVVQGVLTAIVSLVFYGRAVSILGASSGAAFAALSPAMTAVMAIPILGEWPTAMDWIAIAGISAGVYVVSGGPLPRRT
jgi:drug/metabolite transporter (DMT)-like permease